MRRKVVCDIEANGLLYNVTTVHCIVCKEWNTGEVTMFTPDTLDTFEEYASTVDEWVGHNFLAYDLRVLRKVLGVKIRASRVYDTLLISRLQNFNREGGHSLANWGRLLNFSKGDYDEWDEYTEEMLGYCANDVELTYRVAVALKSEGGKRGSVLSERIEHASQHILENQKSNGFALDVPRAHKLFTEVKSRAQELERQILDEMTPIAKAIRVIKPHYKKDGSLSSVGLKLLGKNWEATAGPFTAIKWVEFNLDSPKQKVERLNGWWSPTIRTKGYRKLRDKVYRNQITSEEFELKEPYTWQLCDENFATIKANAPQVLRYLGEYAMCNSRSKEIEGWFDGLGTDNRVHGSVFSIGSGTHRMAHQSPNMANIPGRDSPYGPECRSCWTVSDSDHYCLLGTDAVGIQLRLLAHYMNDAEYTKEVVDGDIHTKNQKAASLSTRDLAKTFIYAWLMGAGSERIGRIIGGTSKDGKATTDRFLANTPALAKFRLHRIAGAAKAGGLVGFDGRWIHIKSEHFGMSVFLQGGEQAVMKWAMLDWHKKARQAGLDFKQVAVVHDEFQTEVARTDAEQLGEIQCQSIRDAGSYFKLNCLMDGEYRIGNNWQETH
jgi:DNA polymerase-1